MTRITAQGRKDIMTGSTMLSDDLWTKGPDSCTREVILAQAEKYQVCPFELSLDLSLWMDVIICDYNYVFDLNV